MANDGDRPGRQQRNIRVLTGWVLQLRGSKRGQAGGQALVEYALIATLVVIAIAAILTVTGPVIGNVFSNTVYNLLGNTFDVNTPYTLGDIKNIATSLASLTPNQLPYETNTPLIPTCDSGPYAGKWAPQAPAPAVTGTYVWPCPGA
jgi:Flp pilus assembly pilin Flp